MKLKITTITALCLISMAALSQAPNSFKYQSMLRKADGSALASQAVKAKISILKGSVSGTAVYSEVHSVTSTSFGIVNFTIGEGADKNGYISGIDWAVDAYFIKVEMDETGGTNYTLSSVSQLLSVPYALFANSVNSVDWTKVQNKPDLTNNVTLTGNQSITGNKTFTGTTAVPAPINPTDAVNKAYVDSLFKMLALRTFDVNALLVGGYTIQDLLDAGRSLQDLFKAKVTKAQLYGAKYKGGLIFYIDSVACTGLVCAEYNLPNTAIWGCQGSIIPGADGTAIGTGQQNTKDIVSACPAANTAAKACDDLVLKGFDDWFLPSKDESQAMFNNLYLKGKGNFSNSDYCWTSTEYNNGTDYGWDLVIFINGFTGNWKNESYKVRAVRAF